MVRLLLVWAGVHLLLVWAGVHLLLVWAVAGLLLEWVVPLVWAVPPGLEVLLLTKARHQDTSRPACNLHSNKNGHSPVYP